MSYQTYLNSLKFGNISDAINSLKQNLLSQLETPFDLKKLDLQTQINNLTNSKEKADSTDGIIGSALSGLGMSGENLALLKNIYSSAKEKLGIGDFKVGDKIDELKDFANDKIQQGLDGLKGKAQDVVDNVKQNIQDGVDNVKQNIQDNVNDFTGGGNTTSEIEMTQPNSWQPQEMQDLSKPQSDVGEVQGLDDTDYMSKPPSMQSNNGTTDGETGAETGAEVGETGAEVGADAGAEIGEIGAEAGAEVGLEALGAGLDATGFLAPVGVALQLAGMGVSIYQAITDGNTEDTLTQDSNMENTIQEQEDKLKNTVQSQIFAGSDVLPSLSSTGLSSITSSFF